MWRGQNHDASRQARTNDSDDMKEMKRMNETGSLLSYGTDGEFLMTVSPSSFVPFDHAAVSERIDGVGSIGLDCRIENGLIGRAARQGRRLAGLVENLCRFSSPIR